MNLNQLYQQCLEMRVGEKRQFELDQLPQRGDLAAVAVKFAQIRKGIAVSFRREDTTVYAYCYIPPLPPKS